MAEPMPNISLLALAEMNDRLQADLAAVRAELEQPPSDRLLLNSYGRRCFDEGRKLAEADLTALRAERDALQEWKATEQSFLIAAAVELLTAGYKGDDVLGGIKWLAEARARLAEIQAAVQQAVTRYAPELDWLQAVCTVGELGTANIK